MIVALVVLAVLLGYVVTATALTPRFYRQLRGTVKNFYSYREDPHTSAKSRAYLYAWLWPIGFFLVVAARSLRQVDEQAELDKQERAELDRFRAEAMKELER